MNVTDVFAGERVGFKGKGERNSKTRVGDIMRSTCTDFSMNAAS